MREIKFEYMLIKDGIVINKQILTLEDIEQKDSNEFCYELLEQNEKVIKRQYTGLKDKNGVEIYESDIIKAIWSKDCDEYIANEEWIGDIFFNYGSFDINGEWCVSLNCFNGTLEVIGNIYENPELLN